MVISSNIFFNNEDCESYFKALFELSDDFIFLLDYNGNFQTCNEFGPALIEFIPEDLIGKHFTSIISFKDKTTVSSSLSGMINKKSAVSFDAIVVSKFGQEVEFGFSIKPILRDSKFIGAAGIAKNISERKEANQIIKDLKSRHIELERFLHIERSRSMQRKSILEELSRLKSEFISNVSHEFRTPLASIIGFSETIDSDPAMPEDLKSEFNKIILMEGKRLAKLINSILNLSKLEEGQISLAIDSFNLKETLKKIIDQNDESIQNKKIIFSYDLPEEEITVCGDEERLCEVFNAILNNAVKFTEEGGRVSLYAQNLYKEIEVIISDTGIGIPNKDIPFLFEKFYRVSRPGTEIPGTGLGLVFAKQIVDLHKGLITIQSEIYKGTTVIIKIPKNTKVEQNKI
jgi:PAS domain S-box-containing protein